MKQQTRVGRSVVNDDIVADGMVGLNSWIDVWMDGWMDQCLSRYGRFQGMLLVEGSQREGYIYESRSSPAGCAGCAGEMTADTGAPLRRRFSFFRCACAHMFLKS